MSGQPWNVGDFELMHYRCVSGVKRDIIVRRVPGPKLIIWRMFQSPDERLAEIKPQANMHGQPFLNVVPVVMTGLQLRIATRAWYNRDCACQK